MKTHFRSLIVSALAAAMFSSSAFAATEADVAKLMSILVGEYTNKHQVDGAAAERAKGGHVARELREVHHMFAAEVPIPGLGGRVAYIEWRNNDAVGTISGQRVWAFSPTPEGIKMRFHTLKPSAKAVLSGYIGDAQKGAAALTAAAKLSVADLNTYPGPCEFMFTPKDGGFYGEIKPGTCTFTSFGSNRVMDVDATMHIMPDRHGEWTDIVVREGGTAEDRSTGKAVSREVEDWVYMRIAKKSGG